MKCPKCRYERQASDTDTYPGICPQCGIAYNKWLAAMEGREKEQPGALSEEELIAQLEAEDPAPWYMRLYYYACFMPSDRHEAAFWGHSLFYAGFFLWGWYFILGGIDWTTAGGSFMHNIHLPFHEYGHIMFSPFGQWWMYLGGSLFQVIVPWFPLVYFMVWQRDNFAASLMLWWSGQSFIDVAPYVADAPIRAIPLITGNDDTHDWWNLLRMSDSLDMANVYAWLWFLIGAAIIVLSNVWGGYLLYVEVKGRTAPPTPADL